jgi:SAM-dependent methyltransferase
MEAQYAAVYAELYRNHWWWRAREEILLQKIRRVLLGATPARILDVGCGAALFFDALEQSGHVEGIDSDRAAVEASGKWRSRIVIGELDDSYTPESPFDLILLLDVDNPDHVLRRAAEILTSSGRILITVPAFKWLWTAHDDMNHHLRRYTAREMRKAIGRAGLITLETGYMFQSLVVTKLLVKAREALTSRCPRVPGIPPPLLNNAVHAWFRAEYSLAGWLPFGGSLLAIAAPRSERV